MASEPQGALSGLRVVEWAQMVAGPYCAKLMADMGAEVIKVEPPRGGDEARSRNGNMDEAMAPHNCYRCRGDDSWVSIAVSSEEEWLSLCRAVGHPEWAGQERFADAPARWRNQEEIDRLLEAWTVGHTPYEVMEALQRVGVAAVPSLTAADIYTDPHLAERGLLEVVDHPELGAAPVFGCPWRLSDSPARISRPGPLFGEHNEYVFGELLGLSREEVSRLEGDKVIW